MDYSKLDAGLMMALGDQANPQAPNLSVFVQTREGPSEDQVAYLRSVGVDTAAVGRQISTATLSAQAIDQLTQQDWVRFLRLSSRLKAYG